MQETYLSIDIVQSARAFPGMALAIRVTWNWDLALLPLETTLLIDPC